MRPNRAPHERHTFEKCPDCGGSLDYVAPGDVVCGDCQEEFSHQVRTNGNGGYRHLLWRLSEDYVHDEVVAHG